MREGGPFTFPHIHTRAEEEKIAWKEGPPKTKTLKFVPFPSLIILPPFDFLLFRLSPSNPPPSSSSSFSREAIKRASLLLLLCRKAARREGKSKSQTRPFSSKSRRGEESGSPRQKKETFRLLEIGRAIEVEEGVAFRSVSSTWQILAALPNQTFASPFLISFLPPSCLLGKGQKKSPKSFFRQRDSRRHAYRVLQLPQPNVLFLKKSLWPYFSLVHKTAAFSWKSKSAHMAIGKEESTKEGTTNF